MRPITDSGDGSSSEDPLLMMRKLRGQFSSLKAQVEEELAKDARAHQYIQTTLLLDVGTPSGPPHGPARSRSSGEDRCGDPGVAGSRYMRIYNLESPRGDPLMQVPAPRRSSGSISLTDGLPLTPQSIDDAQPFPQREPGSPGGSSARSVGSDRSFRRPPAGVRLSVIQDNEIDPSKVLTFEEAKAEEGARYEPRLSDELVEREILKYQRSIPPDQRQRMERDSAAGRAADDSVLFASSAFKHACGPGGGGGCTPMNNSSSSPCARPLPRQVPEALGQRAARASPVPAERPTLPLALQLQLERRSEHDGGGGPTPVEKRKYGGKEEVVDEGVEKSAADGAKTGPGEPGGAAGGDSRWTGGLVTPNGMGTPYRTGVFSVEAQQDPHQQDQVYATHQRGRLGGMSTRSEGSPSRSRGNSQGRASLGGYSFHSEEGGIDVLVTSKLSEETILQYLEENPDFRSRLGLDRACKQVVMDGKPLCSPATEAETTPRLPRNPRPIENWGDAGFESITFRESVKSMQSSSVQPIAEEFEHDIGTIPEDVEPPEEASLSPRRLMQRDLQAEMEEMQREMAKMRAELAETRTREQKVVTEIKGMTVELEDYRQRADLSELLSARACSGDIHSMHVSAEVLSKKLLETQTQLLVMKQREAGRLAEGLKHKVGIVGVPHHAGDHYTAPPPAPRNPDGVTSTPDGFLNNSTTEGGRGPLSAGASFGECTNGPRGEQFVLNGGARGVWGDGFSTSGGLERLQLPGPPPPSGMISAQQQHLLAPDGPPMSTTSAIGTLYPGTGVPPGNVLEPSREGGAPAPRSIHVPSKNPAFGRLYVTPTKHLRDGGLQAHEHAGGPTSAASMQVVGNGQQRGSSSNGLEKTSRGLVGQGATGGEVSSAG